MAQSLTFYGWRPFFSLRDPEALRRVCRNSPRTWVVLPERDLPALREDAELRVDVVEARPYLQISLPAVLGRKPLERTILLVRVVRREDLEAH